MRIWITEIGEPLPLESNTRLHRYGQFSKALAGFGHEVTWWASSFSHAPKKHFATQDTDVDHGGATLRLIHGPGYPRNVSFARIRHSRHFSQRFQELAPRYPKPDLILSPIPTIDTAAVAARFAKENGVKILTDIRDLWPDELADLAPGPLRGLARLALFNAYRQMRFLCRNVDGIMGVSQSYLDYGLAFAGRAQGPNDLVFPLGYSAEPIAPADLEKGLAWARSTGIREDAFVVCFFGTIGKFFDLETVINAAKVLSTEFPVQFVLGGAGSELDRFKKMAAGVPSVLFPGWLNAPQIHAVMKVSKAGLAPYKVGAKMSLPNKPFEYMAGELPVISSIQGELRDILAKGECGLSYRADSVEELCAAVRRLKGDEETRRRMGQNGRRLLEARFSTQKVFEAVNRHLIKVVGKE